MKLIRLSHNINTHLHHHIKINNSYNLKGMGKILSNYNGDDWKYYFKNNYLSGDNITHFPDRNYTKILLPYDTPKINMYLIEWKPGAITHVHGHNGNIGCIFKVLSGNLKETLYGNYYDIVNPDNNPDNKYLINDMYLKKSHINYLNDNIGYHRIQNNNGNLNSYSLHIYPKLI